MDIQGFLKAVGDQVGVFSEKAIKFLSEMGLTISSTQGKMVSFLIILILLYLVIKVIEIPKKIIKYLIIVLLAILAISIGFSMIP